MNDKTTLYAWGSWAKRVLEIENPVLDRIDKIEISVSEETENINMNCPDPVTAEYYFTRTLEQDDRNRFFSSAFRIHIVHCGDNFATGALSSFIKFSAKSGQTYDVALLYVPPPGNNNATVGRFFSTLIANKNLFDFCAIVDSCAPSIICLGDDDIYITVSQIASLLALFDRSGSVIPILHFMKTRLASFVFGSLNKLLATDFWELFVARNSIAIPSSINIQNKTKNYLAFSVSNTVNKQIQYLFDGALGKNRFIFLPFLKRFEWRYQNIPKAFADPEDSGKDFFCMINQNLLPVSIFTYLKDYYKEYWIENGKHTAHERITDDSLRWLKALSIPYIEANNAFACLDELKTAKAFLETI